MVAPTTLLARQHAKTLPRTVPGVLGYACASSRGSFSAKDAADTRNGLADGSISIVVGTHALLAKSIKFCNLGLLVIDEEQHFGVQHKERLKQLRSDVHVLTMTATPIPRTLQLAMSGVRELSRSSQPRPSTGWPCAHMSRPSTRSPCARRCCANAIAAARRSSWCPRIADLPDAEEWLREHVPEVTFVTLPTVRWRPASWTSA